MNWYKTATAEKKPYKIYQIGAGKDIEIIELKDIWAYSSEQARIIALKNSPKLKAFVDHCLRLRSDCDIEARIDRVKLEEVQKYQASLRQRQEEKEQNNWWDK
jgi:hypothetical protein